MKLRLELTFSGELKNEPIIWYLGNHFRLVFNIVEASFSTEVGWVILILEGEDEELEKACDYLRSKKVTIERIERVA